MFASSQLPQFIGVNFYTEPKICTYHNAIYVGGTDFFDNQHGIFSQEGHLITSTAFFHKYPPEIKGQPLSINPNTAKNYPVIEDAYFAGHFHNQYGHFLTEFISRIWAYKKYKLKLPILVRTAHCNLTSLISAPWAKTLLDLLDLKKSDFITPVTPIKIKKLTIPDPLFAEQGYCYKHMMDFCHTLGDKAISTLSETSLIKNSNIYFSRSKLRWGTTKTDNEAILDEELKKLGFIIIHPQDHSIFEQISFFRNNNIISGTVGSAFHTSIFSPSPQGVAINMKDYPDINYLIMDGVNNASIDYVTSIDNVIFSSKPDGNFYQTRTIINPKLFAIDLYNFVMHKRNNFSIANMGKAAITYKPNITFQKIKPSQEAKEKTIKVDSRNGQISTNDGSFLNDLLLVTLQINNQYKKNFLMVNSDQPSIIHYGQTAASIFPVNINKINDTISIYIINEEKYLITSNNEAINFETYTPVNFNHTIEKKEGLILLCSILCSIFDPASYSNMEYYNNVYPDLVNSIFEIKNSLHREIYPTINNSTNDFEPLHCHQSQKCLNGKIITHRSNIGDILVKGIIDTSAHSISPIEAITIQLNHQLSDYTIKYTTQAQGEEDWSEWLHEGILAGTKGENKPLIGFSAKIFNIQGEELPCICFAKFNNDEIIHSYTGGVLFSSPNKQKLVGFAVYLA